MPPQLRMVTLCTLVGALPLLGADSFELPSPGLRWQDLPDTNTRFQPRSFVGLAEWQARRAALIEQIRFAAALWPEPARTPLQPREFDLIEQGDYTISKVHFESSPGFYVTGNLFRPRDMVGKVPAVVVAHGHAARGRLHHDDRTSAISACIAFARMGIIAFAYDMLGYNDAGLQTPHVVDTPQRSLWGIGSFGLQTWNSTRVVDYLQSLAEVDPQRIGMTGASGGGTQTFILSAIDERIVAAAPVCMVSAHMQGGCQCENAPALRIETNNVEITSCIAPRPLLLVSATGDWTDQTPTVEFPAIRAIYELYGCADKVSNTHVDAEHNFNYPSRLAVERFMARHLLNRTLPEDFQESPFDVELLQRLRVFAQEPVKAEVEAKAERFISQAIKMQKARLDSLSPAAAADLRTASSMFTEGLKHTVRTSFPRPEEIQVGPRDEQPTSLKGWLAKEALLKNQAFLEKVGSLPTSKERYYVRNQRAVRTLELLSSASPDEPGAITICVHPDGIAAAERMERFVLTCMSQSQSDRVIFVQPFGSDSAFRITGKPRGSSQYFSTFNRTDLAETVYDLVTVIAAQCKNSDRISQVNLIGFAEMGVPLLLARTLIPAEVVEKLAVATVIDMRQMDIDSDDAYLKHANLPHIRRIGGLKFAASAANTGPLWLYDVNPTFPRGWLEQAAKTRGLPVRITDGPATDESIAHWAAAQKWVKHPPASSTGGQPSK